MTTAEALQFAFISPNVADSNGENANVVDALASIAVALNRIALAMENANANRSNRTRD
jgi:hypothetical protein